jgi:hypothetical protein
MTPFSNVITEPAILTWTLTLCSVKLLHPLLPPNTKNVCTQDPRVVTKYAGIVQQHISYHKLDDKMTYLYNAAINGVWTQQMAREYKKIDKLLTEGMLHAEREVSKKCSRRFQWSPKFSRALKTLH